MAWKTIKNYTDGSSLERNNGEGYYYAKKGQKIEDWKFLCPDDNAHSPADAEKMIAKVCKVSEELLKEFAINLPMAGVSAVSSVAGSIETAPTYDVTSSVAVPVEVDTSKHEHITVYVDGASVSNYNVKDPCVCVDVVLTVSIQNPITYANSSYKLVKRLSMDKVKLALQAEVLTPFQVVEAKTEEQVQAEKLAEAQADAAAKAARRAKELAGLI